jgi:hypothetical protein
MNNPAANPEWSLPRINMAEKIFANVISLILHPVFVPLYITWFIVYVHPAAFTGFSMQDKTRVIMIVALNAVFFPLFSVFLLRALGFIKSIKLHDQKDRIIPFIASGIFFFWTYIIFKEQARFPDLIRILFLGIFLASSLGLIINIYMKPSLHAIGMGGWTGFFLVILAQNDMLMTWPLAIAILLTGAVCSARLMVSDHRPSEILAGLLTGLICQVIAAIVI